MSYENVSGRRLPFFVRYLMDILAYRHLAANLVASDLRSRFRRSYLGILWAIIQPLCFSLIVGYVWGTVFHAPSFWLFAFYVFSGMIVWEYFATVIGVSQDALTSAEGYLKQTRIPFFIFQIRTAMSGLVVFLFGSIGLLAMMLVLNAFSMFPAETAPRLGPHLLLVAAFYPVAFIFMAPLAIIMSIMGTQFRDLRYITALAVQALFFVSPVMLTKEVFNSPRMLVFDYFNPMNQLLHMFRAPLLENMFWTQQQMLTVGSWTAAFWLMAIWMSASHGRKLVFAL